MGNFEKIAYATGRDVYCGVGASHVNQVWYQCLPGGDSSPNDKSILALGSLWCAKILNVLYSMDMII
jgi:hypothetical protein